MLAAQNQDMVAVQDKTNIIATILNYGEIEDYSGLATDNIRMTIIDPSGWIYFDSHQNADFSLNRSHRPEFIQAALEGRGESIRGSDTFGVNTYYYAVLLDNGYVLRLSRTFMSLGEIFPRILPQLIIITLVISGAAYVIARRLTYKIIKPLAEVDLDTPTTGDFYEELEPFLQKIAHQRQALDGQLDQRREFTANVSHELKTPLTTISALAEMIATGMAKNEDVANFAEKISNRTKRLIALIEDIIRLSEFDESKVDGSFTTFDLYEITQQVVGALQEKAAEKQITISVTGAAFSVYGNQHLIHELIFNLVENAIKYNREAGSVTINLTEDGNCRKISVSDTGMGIPEEYRSRIFERFYRVDKSRSQAIGGTGLGLSIAKHIADHHGGKLELDSREGKGSTFTFSYSIPPSSRPAG